MIIDGIVGGQLETTSIDKRRSRQMFERREVPVLAICKCIQNRLHITMGRWKRFGVIVVRYSTDHDPRHVHVFEDGKRLLKFDIENWRVMEGKLTTRARKALERLRQEGVL